MFTGTIGVLRGGPGSHYDMSLASGAHVIKHLRDKYPVRDIFIDKEGTWHYEGMPTSLDRLISHIDLFWNALHGEYGEDGTVERELDNLGARYTGPSSIPARFSWRKDLARGFLREAGLLVPETLSVRVGDDIDELVRKAFASIGGQYVVKPVAEGESRGVFLVASFPELKEVLRVALEHFDHILVEEAIHGKEIKCVVAQGFRGQELYTFLPIEVRKGSHLAIYKPENKSHNFVSPAILSRDETSLVLDTARSAHRALGLGSYSLVDMLLAPRGVVVLEVDALPALGEGSVLAKSLEAVGAKPHEFFSHIAQNAFVLN